jgi:hypothetical protein
MFKNKASPLLWGGAFLEKRYLWNRKIPRLLNVEKNPFGGKFNGRHFKDKIF